MRPTVAADSSCPGGGQRETRLPVVELVWAGGIICTEVFVCSGVTAYWIGRQNTHMPGEYWWIAGAVDGAFLIAIIWTLALLVRRAVVRLRKASARVNISRGLSVCIAVAMLFVSGKYMRWTNYDEGVAWWFRDRTDFTRIREWIDTVPVSGDVPQKEWPAEVKTLSPGRVSVDKVARRVEMEWGGSERWLVVGPKDMAIPPSFEAPFTRVTGYIGPGAYWWMWKD